MPEAAAPAAPPSPEDREREQRALSPAARRALAEAAERRAAATAPEAAPREVNGRGGLEPVRYGDWEIKGLTSDF